MFVLGHLGFSLLGARLARPLWSGRFPVAWLLLGAMVPDLIDKPLGHWLLPWDNGRIFAHTLLFGLVLGVLAWVWASRALSGVTLGVVLHHVLDQVPWSDPGTWLWPVLGGFERGVSSGAPAWLASLLSDPFVWATEALGFVFVGLLLVAPLVGWGDRWWEPTGEERGPSPPGETPERSPAP